MFYVSSEHHQRFLSALHDIRKVYDGIPDCEYASALYILTSRSGLWNKASAFVSHHGIDIAELLQERDFSSGFATTVAVAGNLFNGQTKVNPVDFCGLDETNFKVVMQAIVIRRNNYPLSEFEQKEK